MERVFTFTDTQRSNLHDWAQALRTTPLLQGEGFLRDFSRTAALDTHEIDLEEYCCLGVYVAEKHPTAWSPPSPMKRRYFVNGCDTRLPACIARELGLTEELENIFITLNDKYHFTFAMIASEIDALITTGKFLKETTQIIFPSRWEGSD